MTAHAVVVAELLEKDQMAVVDPFSGPLVLTAWLAVLTAAEEQRPITETVVEIQQLPITDLLDCIKVA